MAIDYPIKPEDMAGVSIVNGAVGVDVDAEGSRRGKRKVMRPAIKEESSDDSDTPLVSLFLYINTRFGSWTEASGTRHSISCTSTFTVVLLLT